MLLIVNGEPDRITLHIHAGTAEEPDATVVPSAALALTTQPAVRPSRRLAGLATKVLAGVGLVFLVVEGLTLPLPFGHGHSAGSSFDTASAIPGPAAAPPEQMPPALQQALASRPRVTAPPADDAGIPARAENPLAAFGLSR